MAPPAAPKKKPVNYANAWIEAKALLAQYRTKLAIGMGLMLVSRAAGVVLPFTTKALMDEVVAKRRVELLWPIALLAAGMKPDDVKKEVTGNSPGALQLVKQGRVDCFFCAIGVVVALLSETCATAAGGITVQPCESRIAVCGQPPVSTPMMRSAGNAPLMVSKR